ncbi:MAG: hypothetical protein K1X89_30895, partial [Myxococcaceae bacterium]|nr:hypothetical protein [Myxococcaceae bacterium]
GGGSGGGSGGGAAGGAGGGSGGGAAGGGSAGGAGGGAGGGTAGGAGGGSVGPNQLIFTTSPPTPVLAGDCVATTIQSRLNGSPQAVASAANVALTVSPTGAAAYFSDAACTTAITSVTIAPTKFNANFFVKPISGVMVTLSATASFGTATQSFTPLPAVRTGFCSFASVLSDGGPDLEVQCPIAPPQQVPAHTALFFQASAATPSPTEFEIRCRLTSASTITCDRQAGTGTAGFVRWHTLELPTGLRVQTGEGGCPGAIEATTALPMSVDPAKSFLLRSNTAVGSLDDDEFVIGRITSPTTYLQAIGNAASGCGATPLRAFQVVELDGTSVVRGVLDAGLPPGTNVVQVTGLPAASTNAAVLVQTRVADAVLQDCSMALRGTLPSTTSLTISRGNASNDGGCALEQLEQLAWERIDFQQRARVQAITVSLSAGTTQQSTAISPVDPTRTVVFAAGMPGSGQSGGESSPSGANNAAPDAVGRFDISGGGTTLTVRRDGAAAAATFTVWVVEVNP